MIVKMTILRLLGLSDDKEKEKIGVTRPEGPPLRGFRPESSSVSSTGRTDARGIGASDACRKNRRYEVWCRRESKPSANFDDLMCKFNLLSKEHEELKLKFESININDTNDSLEMKETIPCAIPISRVDASTSCIDLIDESCSNPCNEKLLLL